MGRHYSANFSGLWPTSQLISHNYFIEQSQIENEGERIMKRLVYLLLALASVNTYAGDLVTLSARLDGANAVPPNESPLLGFGDFTFSKRYTTPDGNTVIAHEFGCSVYFPGFNFEAMNIFPDVASIQDASGNVISNEFVEFYLGRKSFGVPIAPIVFEGRFSLTPSQTGELLSGRWFVNVTAKDSEGNELPEATIRGQILPIRNH